MNNAEMVKSTSCMPFGHVSFLNKYVSKALYPLIRNVGSHLRSFRDLVEWIQNRFSSKDIRLFCTVTWKIYSWVYQTLYWKAQTCGFIRNTSVQFLPSLHEAINLNYFCTRLVYRGQSWCALS